MSPAEPPEGWQTHERRHPPFPPGNDVAVRHGAYSTRVIAPRAAAILAEVTADPPDWLHAVDAGALTAWAETEARSDVLRQYTNEHGLLDSKGKPTGAADLLLRNERLAASQRARLGFDPLSRATLRRDTAIGAAVAGQAVAHAAAAGRAIREAREAASGRD